MVLPWAVCLFLDWGVQQRLCRDGVPATLAKGRAKPEPVLNALLLPNQPPVRRTAPEIIRTPDAVTEKIDVFRCEARFC